MKTSAEGLAQKKAGTRYSQLVAGSSPSVRAIRRISGHPSISSSPAFETGAEVHRQPESPGDRRGETPRRILPPFSLPALLYALLYAPVASALPHSSNASCHLSPPEIGIQWPERRLWVGAENIRGIAVNIRDQRGGICTQAQGELRLKGLETERPAQVKNGVALLSPATIASEKVFVTFGASHIEKTVPILSPYWSLLPALVAVILALATKQILLSLLLGILFGVFLLRFDFLSTLEGTFALVTQVATEPDKTKIILFTLLVSTTVGLISQNGGTQAILGSLSRFGKSRRTAALATWAMGLVIFFDDYASALLTGTTMRPITDRLKISREKLAYLVDSTTAPITSLALISTWIGYEISILEQALHSAGIERKGYEVFIAGLGSRFYPILALGFVFLVAWTGRDFGPMLQAERRAQKTGKLVREGAEPLGHAHANLKEKSFAERRTASQWWLAALPLLILVFSVITVLVVTGVASAQEAPKDYALAQAEGLVRTASFILGRASAYDALLYGAGITFFFTFFLTVGTKALSFAQATAATLSGARSMMLAVLVLILAWSIGEVMKNLHAGAYIVSVIGESIPASVVGATTFLLAAVTAFATGTSWGTMAILFPIVTPIVARFQGTEVFESVLLGGSSAVLAGAIFGDHCSPISDTTILSSVACASDHIDHTRTQLPYALLCGAVSVVFGYLPYGFGASPLFLLPICFLVLWAVLRFAGQKV